MSPADAPAKVISELRNRIEKLVSDHSGAIERNTLAWYDNLVDKYGATLRHLEAQARHRLRPPQPALQGARIWLSGEMKHLGESGLSLSTGSALPKGSA